MATLKRHGNCGGTIVACNGPFGTPYEVLGREYSPHTWRALCMNVARRDNPTTSEFYMIYEKQHWDIEARVYQYPANLDWTHGKVVLSMKLGASMFYGLKELEERRGKPYIATLQKMAEDWEQIYSEYYGKSIEPFREVWTVHLKEHGLPFEYKAKGIYVNGPGYSIEPEDSIVRYVMQEDGSVKRWELKRGKMIYEVYRKHFEEPTRLTTRRCPTIEEALWSKTYHDMTEWLMDASENIFGHRMRG